MSNNLKSGLAALFAAFITALLFAGILFLLQELPGQKIAHWLSRELGLIGDLIITVGIGFFCVALPGLVWYCLNMLLDKVILGKSKC